MARRGRPAKDVTAGEGLSLAEWKLLCNMAEAEADYWSYRAERLLRDLAVRTGEVDTLRQEVQELRDFLQSLKPGVEGSATADLPPGEGGG